MTATSRRALLRELSAHPRPDDPLADSDPGPLATLDPLDARGRRASQDYLVLLLFAAECCGVEAKRLTPLDLMQALSNLRGGRPPAGGTSA